MCFLDGGRSKSAALIPSHARALSITPSTGSQPLSNAIASESGGWCARMEMSIRGHACCWAIEERATVQGRRVIEDRGGIEGRRAIDERRTSVSRAGVYRHLKWRELRMGLLRWIVWIGQARCCPASLHLNSQPVPCWSLPSRCILRADFKFEETSWKFIRKSTRFCKEKMLKFGKTPPHIPVATLPNWNQFWEDQIRKIRWSLLRLNFHKTSKVCINFSDT